MSGGVDRKENVRIICVSSESSSRCGEHAIISAVSRVNDSYSFTVVGVMSMVVKDSAFVICVVSCIVLVLVIELLPVTIRVSAVSSVIVFVVQVVIRVVCVRCELFRLSPCVPFFVMNERGGGGAGLTQEPSKSGGGDA
jgi:hypothetical protein